MLPAVRLFPFLQKYAKKSSLKYAPGKRVLSSRPFRKKAGQNAAVWGPDVEIVPPSLFFAGKSPGHPVVFSEDDAEEGLEDGFEAALDAFFEEGEDAPCTLERSVPLP